MHRLLQNDRSMRSCQLLQGQAQRDGVFFSTCFIFLASLLLSFLFLRHFACALSPVIGVQSSPIDDQAPLPILADQPVSPRFLWGAQALLVDGRPRSWKENPKNDGDIDGDTGPMLPDRTSPGQEVGAQGATTGKARVLEAFHHGGEKTAHNKSIRAE